ncbi:MAG: hypothetical protein M3447_07160, partial [Acidobacteriota bacterium]|nr:hypothetical protein [Acidobacteriota bacterium]
MKTSDSQATQNDEPAYSAVQGSKLIEFPGVTRSTVPQWRKDLSERVRELQEKRAREEALELSFESNPEVNEAAPQLELLPQAETTPVNPLVAAALRRIERAHDSGAYLNHSSNSSGATAVAYATPMRHEETSLDEAVPLAAAILDEESQPREAEKAHNLVVVPALATVETDNTPKPKRMIGDINDPALNYLDSVRTSARVETSAYKRASVAARVVSAIVDLAVVTVLCAPFAAALELANTNWQ